MDKFSHSSIHDIIVSSIMSVQAAKFVASVFWPQTQYESVNILVINTCKDWPLTIE